MLTRGMRMSLTSASTSLPNAAPIIMPMARSTTLPLKANVLNSSKSDQGWRVGTADAIGVIGALDSARFNGSILCSLSTLGSEAAHHPVQLAFATARVQETNVAMLLSGACARGIVGRGSASQQCMARRPMCG